MRIAFSEGVFLNIISNYPTPNKILSKSYNQILIMNESEICSNLLNEFISLQPDLKKFEGNPAVAYAERLIIFINKLTPYAGLFDDHFKSEVKNYVITYQAAQNGTSEGKNIFKLVKPLNQLITETLESKISGKNC